MEKLAPFSTGMVTTTVIVKTEAWSTLAVESD